MPTATESKSERARRNGPPTFDRLQKKQARTRRVHIPLDDELARRVMDLTKDVESDRLYMAKVRGSGGEDQKRAEELERKERQLEELREELRDETVVMRFSAIGRKRYEALIAEHPLSEEQKAEYREKGDQLPDFNPDTFPAALVAASCVEPDLTEEQAQEIWDTWNQGELTVLFTAAFEVNTQRRVVDLGEG